MGIVQRLPDGSEPAPAPLVLAEPRHVGTVAAELVLNRLWARPHARMLLPTGRSPQSMYAVLRAHSRAGQLPPGTATVLQLDEYAGPGPGDPRSFAAQLRAQLEGIPLGAIRTIDGAAPDPASEAARHAAVLEEAPIDLAVLGLGRDGHVAFDEPPARMASGVAVVSLAAMTREDAAPAFGGAEHVPARALTTGLGTLYRARELILLVSGAAKAPALRAMLEGPVDPRSTGLAPAGPSSPDDHLRPGGGVPAAASARVLQRPRDRRARPQRSRCQRRAPDLRRVAGPAAPRAAAGAPQPRSGRWCSRATPPREGCRRPSR